MQKPLIVFVGAVYPSQYSLLCSHLRSSGMADSWFMTTPGRKANHEKDCDHLLSFQPDGKIVGPQSYYYSSKVERSARICRGVLKALKDFEKAQGRRIDLVVAHSLWGAPNWLYDELDAAIVSYIEFPSYRSHGCDAAYPPDEAQRLADRNTEMLHFHQVLCSDLTIVPSAHARSLFPPLLQDRVAVQFEGFDIQPPLRQSPPPHAGEQPFTIAFSARDLSSAKGLETNWGFIPELVQNDVNGLLLPDNDDAWIQAIRALRADPARPGPNGMARRRRRPASSTTSRTSHRASWRCSNAQ